MANERSTGRVFASSVRGPRFNDSFTPPVLVCDACGTRDDFEIIFRRFTFDLPAPSFADFSIIGVFANVSANSSPIPEPPATTLTLAGILAGMAYANRRLLGALRAMRRQRCMEFPDGQGGG
jgi:hypothetical protein